MRILRYILPSVFLTGLLHLSFAMVYESPGSQTLIAHGGDAKLPVVGRKLAKKGGNPYKNAISTGSEDKVAAPTANDDAASTNEDTDVSIDILGNDADGGFAINSLTVDFDAAAFGYQSSITTA